MRYFCKHILIADSVKTLSSKLHSYLTLRSQNDEMNQIVDHFAIKLKVASDLCHNAQMGLVGNVYSVKAKVHKLCESLYADKTQHLKHNLLESEKICDILTKYNLYR